jgi:hypothetical protein
MTITPKFYRNTLKLRPLEVEVLGPFTSTALAEARQEAEDGLGRVEEDDGALWRVLRCIMSGAAEAGAAMATLDGACPRHHPFTDD